MSSKRSSGLPASCCALQPVRRELDPRHRHARLHAALEFEQRDVQVDGIAEFGVAFSCFSSMTRAVPRELGRWRSGTGRLCSRRRKRRRHGRAGACPTASHALTVTRDGRRSTVSRPRVADASARGRCHLAGGVLRTPDAVVQVGEHEVAELGDVRRGLQRQALARQFDRLREVRAARRGTPSPGRSGPRRSRVLLSTDCFRARRSAPAGCPSRS